MKKFFRLAVLSFFVCACLCACGQEEQDFAEEKGGQMVIETDASMEKLAVLTYEIPQIKPGILVNCDGYLAMGEKTAYILAKEAVQTFQVRDAVTDKVVLEGEIKWPDEAQTSMGQADFTALQEQGQYYLFAPVVGASKVFSVEEDYCGKAFAKLLDKVRERARDNTAELDALAELLVLYEWYPELFSDEDDNRIPDVLEFIAGWSEREETESMKTAAVMAKFSYLYQKYDLKLATKILNKASVLYKKNRDAQGMDAEMFFALTELYRATGLYDYRTKIEEYKDFFEKNTDYLYRQGYLFGTMTYISTYQKVSRELCEILLGGVNAKAQENANYFRELIQPVTAKNNGPKEIFGRLEIMIAANYVMNNPEYNRIIEETWDYLAGQNEFSRVYMEEEDSEAGYLLLAGQMHAVEEKLRIE